MTEIRPAMGRREVVEKTSYKREKKPTQNFGKGRKTGGSWVAKGEASKETF